MWLFYLWTCQQLVRKFNRRYLLPLESNQLVSIYFNGMNTGYAATTTHVIKNPHFFFINTEHSCQKCFKAGEVWFTDNSFSDHLLPACKITWILLKMFCISSYKDLSCQLLHLTVTNISACLSPWWHYFSFAICLQ